jgi:tRNA threonylcarbamoyl adenosine modification protein (Sua5/YciO/YrdC/YwlC family)
VAQFFTIHPDNPQPRLIRQAVEIIRSGGVIVYPTDSCYALGCHLGDKDAVDRIRRIRAFDENHHMTLVCRDLSEIAKFARVDNVQYRLLKANTPGSYTFILKATRELPRRLLHPKRSTIGLRVPDHPVVQALLTELDEPLMSSTLILAGDNAPLTEAEQIRERLEHEVDLILDGGNCGLAMTTVIDLSEGEPHVTRVGKGRLEPFGLAA